MKKKGLLVILAVLVGVVVIGLLVHNLSGSTGGKSEIIDDHTFIDDDGEKIVLEEGESFDKIISLYSAHTENLYTIGAGNKIIGVSSTSIYPPDAAYLPRYDYNSDPEKVIAAEPDLVIIRPFISRNYPDFVSTLKETGITVVSLYPENGDEFEKYIEILGMITGKEAEATDQLALLDSRIAAINDQVKDITDKKNVFFESTQTNYRTVTDDSNPGRAIVLAGGINIAAGAEAVEKGSTIAEFGIEKILMNADDIDLYVSQRGSMNAGGSSLSISQREGFDTIKAVKNGDILELNEKIISSPTFRYYKGVNEIARALYPEIMDNYDDLKSDDPITREDYAILTVKIDHSPIFIPSSSHYYETTYYNHTYGMFEDVQWDDENFDFIETSVLHSFLKSHKSSDGTETFDKESDVTREELADTVNIMLDLTADEEATDIADLDACENATIVQKVVGSGLMTTTDGLFEPQKTVTANEAIEVLVKAKAMQEK